MVYTNSIKFLFKQTVNRLYLTSAPAEVVSDSLGQFGLEGDVLMVRIMLEVGADPDKTFKGLKTGTA